MNIDFSKYPNYSIQKNVLTTYEFEDFLNFFLRLKEVATF